MTRSFPAITLCICVLLVPYEAGAACYRFTSEDAVEVAHKDLGAGIVKYRTGQHAIHPYSSTLVVESCQSAAAINVRVATGKEDPSDGGSITLFDVTNEAEAVLDDALRSDAVEAFDDLAASFKSLGASVARSKVTHESCACNKWYPDMRGTKTKFGQVDY
ncbi:hypothetical protein [Tateyamaria sp. syn59]|uniref:hypothetical protein n=1 Tax=Tateyamaria sp. syn59 TaxID=2576942 RepID=UPI0011BDB0A4|nr:hypothetical protein [Tateyamaria sp. syn59]